MRLNLMITDREIVQGILCRDVELTKKYLYIEYYPLFKSVWNKYYTDCKSCIEFINTIYVYIMTPGPQSGKSPLESFGFRCHFVLWLKIVSENYCRQLFKKRLEIEEGTKPTDRNISESSSIDISSVNHSDIEIVLAQMPNMRYRTLIRYRYLEEKTNEETAELLGMSMDNYYNKHKLAKEQFTNILKKEGLI